MKTLSKRLKTAKEKVDFTSTYTIEKGMQLVKEIASAKFNESIEAHISLNIDPICGPTIKNNSCFTTRYWKNHTNWSISCFRSSE